MPALPFRLSARAPSAERPPSPPGRSRPRGHSPLRRAGAVLFAVAALVLAAFALPGKSSTATAATCGTTNLALNKTATASSTENAGFPASDAVDGNTGTRWSSAFSDPQWLQVDLGSSQSICGVTLHWETAYATAFQIQTSADGSTWTRSTPPPPAPAAPRT